MSLSDYWKVKKSEIQTIELKEALLSLDRLLKTQLPDEQINLHFGKSDSTHVQRDRNTGRLNIQVSPTPILKTEQFPIPPEIFDVECGLALHEAAHVLAKADATLWRYGDSAKQKVYDLINTLGEEFVADNFYGNSSKQMQYIRSARKYYNNPTAVSKNEEPLTEACRVYTQMLIYNNPNVAISPEAQKILLTLLDNFAKLDVKDPQNRVGIYQTTTDALYTEIRNKEIEKQISKPKGQRSSAGKAGSSNTQQENKIRQQMSQALSKAEAELEEETQEEVDELFTEEMQKQLEDSIEHESEDITEKIAEMVQAHRTGEENPEGTPTLNYAQSSTMVGTTIAEKSNSKDFYNENVELSESLRWLNNLKEERLKIQIHNLDSGKIHSRKLYKLVTKTSASVFRERKTEKRQTRKIWLVLDGSGSMRDHEEFFEACASLQAVLKDSHVYQYFYRKSIQIKRIDAQNKIRYESPDGDTPSGNALLYVVDKMAREEKTGIIIHLSDGGTNHGVSSHETEQILKKYTTIRVCHLLYRTNAWKENAETVDSLEEFSEKLKKIFMESYGIKM